MSASMYWRPRHESDATRRIPDGLMFCLRESYGTNHPIFLTEADLPTLRAIRYLTEGRLPETDAAAQGLIDMIETYKELELYLQF